jgi:hypothetical protein
VGDNNHVVFGQKVPGEKGNVRRVLCRDATASSFIVKVQVDGFAYFHVVALKVHSRMMD